MTGEQETSAAAAAATVIVWRGGIRGSAPGTVLEWTGRQRGRAQPSKERPHPHLYIPGKSHLLTMKNIGMGTLKGGEVLKHVLKKYYL